jgi:dGTPase
MKSKSDIEKLSVMAHKQSNSERRHYEYFLRKDRQRDDIDFEKQELEARIASPDEEHQGFIPATIGELYRHDELYRPADKYRRNATPRDIRSYETTSDYARILHSPSFRRLQGKTQLFPAGESEVLRTRLTHTLEVAEIASRIAGKINATHNEKKLKIDQSIVAAASLAHDLGHPPFGHSGEIALNKKMQGYGGFEGNAQTLRIISKLENRISRHHPQSDPAPAVSKDPLGLNMLYRTIASCIKYDQEIPYDSSSKKPPKGYYYDDRDIVEIVREKVIRGGNAKRLKTVECQIMDIADDIAYSTYDLEDCMVAGVVTPLDMMSCPQDLLEEIAKEAQNEMEKDGYFVELNSVDVHTVFIWLFMDIVRVYKADEYKIDDEISMSIYMARSYNESLRIAGNHHIRRRLTEILIERAINSIEVRWDESNPELSKVRLGSWEKLVIECLKKFNYLSVVRSHRLKISETKSEQIIGTIFDAVKEDKDDIIAGDAHDPLFVHLRNGQFGEDGERKRMRYICDFIAAMTDRQALEMYARLTSDRQVSVFGLTI